MGSRVYNAGYHLADEQVDMGADGDLAEVAERAGERHKQAAERAVDRDLLRTALVVLENLGQQAGRTLPYMT